MSSEGSRVFARYAVAAGLALALGPLTALTVASVAEGTANQRFVSVPANRAVVNDGVSGVSSAYNGKLLSDVADGSGSLDFFNSVLRASQVQDILRGNGQHTIFIPVNAAFSGIGRERIATILNDPAEVRALAKAHMVSGRITAPALMSGKRMTALSGDPINARAGAGLTVNGASIIATERAENGIVHYVDRLL